jgi:hypothetical protein
VEIVITPNTTYILSDYSTPRHIDTDACQWLKDHEPDFLGYLSSCETHQGARRIDGRWWVSALMERQLNLR